jgi:deazaflavin-dependent oxidoreductase (nitroreductase family)
LRITPVPVDPQDSTVMSGALKRWLYRGQRPHALARTINWLWARVGAAGLTKGYLVTLEVRGRQSGRLITLPVVVAVVAGQRYLVSMLGNDAAWVKNVRAAGGRAVMRSGSAESVQLEDVPPAERAPLLKAYLLRAPGARAHVPVDCNAQVSEFEKVASEYPVFRVVPAK